MKPNTVICPDSGRIIPKAYARVAGIRFKSPIDGYRAAAMPDAILEGIGVAVTPGEAHVCRGQGIR